MHGNVPFRQFALCLLEGILSIKLWPISFSLRHKRLDVREEVLLNVNEIRMEPLSALVQATTYVKRNLDPTHFPGHEGL